jgi:hypothetical protein
MAQDLPPRHISPTTPSPLAYDAEVRSSETLTTRPTAELPVPPSREHDLEHVKSGVSAELYEAVLGSLAKGHIKEKDAKKLLELAASGTLDERVIFRVLSIAATVKDAQWIGNRLEDGGVALLLKCPNKKLYAEYLANLKATPGPRQAAPVSFVFSEIRPHPTAASEDQDGQSRKILGIKPLSQVFGEQSEQNSIEATLAVCATAAEEKKRREKLAQNELEDYKTVALEVAELINSCSDVDNLVPNPVQTDFIADTPGDDIMSLEKYRQLVVAAKATRARLTKPSNNNTLV